MRKKTERSYPIPAADNLNNIALHYLSRYAATEQSLRRVLKNRLRRAARFNPAFASDDAVQEKLRQAIDQIIERFRKSGLLNDRSFAENKIVSLRRSGRSRRAIAQKLAEAGIAQSLLMDLLSEEEDPENQDRTAAETFARKKRLGPYRPGETSPDRLRKDLASLARAGFSLKIAREILKPSMG